MASSKPYTVYVPETQLEQDLNLALLEDEDDRSIFITPSHINEKDSDSAASGDDVGFDNDFFSVDSLLDTTTVPSSVTPLKCFDGLALSSSPGEIKILPGKPEIANSSPFKTVNELNLPEVGNFNMPSLKSDDSLSQISIPTDPLSSSDDEVLLSAVIPKKSATKKNFKSVSASLDKPENSPESVDTDLLDFKSNPPCPFVNQNEPNPADTSVEKDTSKSSKPPKSRFHKATEKEVTKLQLDSKAARTQKQTKWGINVFKEWCLFSGISSDFEQLSSGELGILFKNFFAEVRQTDGTTYSRSSLLCIRASLARHLTGPPYNRPFNIMTHADFIPMNAVLSGTIKNKKKDGEDTSQSHPDIIPSDIQLMYDTRTLSDDNPRSLLYKTYFELSLHFGRRGREGLRDLKKEQILFKQDSNGNEYCTLSFHPFEKNHTGSSHHEEEHKQIMYSTGGPDCPVASLKYFISKLHPDCSALFQKPKAKNFEKSTIWYHNSPLGLNSIGQLMPTISKAAGTTIRYTNHCIRATAVTSLRAAGKQALDIKAVTGHKSVSSIDSYSSVTDEQRMDMSHKLSKFLGKQVHTTDKLNKSKEKNQAASVAPATLSAPTPLSKIEPENLSLVPIKTAPSHLPVIEEEQLSPEKQVLKPSTTAPLCAFVKPSPRKFKTPTRSSPRLQLKYTTSEHGLKSSKKVLFQEEKSHSSSSTGDEILPTTTCEEKKSPKEEKDDSRPTIIIQGGSTIHIHYH